MKTVVVEQHEVSEVRSTVGHIGNEDQNRTTSIPTRHLLQRTPDIIYRIHKDTHFCPKPMRRSETGAGTWKATVAGSIWSAVGASATPSTLVIVGRYLRTLLGVRNELLEQGKRDLSTEARSAAQILPMRRRDVRDFMGRRKCRSSRDYGEQPVGSQ